MAVFADVRGCRGRWAVAFGGNSLGAIVRHLAHYWVLQVNKVLEMLYLLIWKKVLTIVPRPCGDIGLKYLEDVLLVLAASSLCGYFR